MATKEIKQNAGTEAVGSNSWIPAIVPILRIRWADEIAASPLTHAINLSDWLALLHAATTSPEKIPYYLTKLLHYPKSGTDIQNSWTALATLFSVSFSAARASADKFDSQAWQGLLQTQTRVIEAAATVSLVRPKRPSTDILTRRALYLQTITALNKKLATIRDSNKLLDEVVSLLHQNLNYEYVTLFLLNQSRQTLTLQSALWKNRQPNAKEFTPLQIGGSEVTARAAVLEQILLVNDFSQAPQYLPHPALSEVKAQLSVPLLADHHLLGILDIASDRVNAFSVDDRHILQALASHIAVIIENARLQGTLQRHMREQKLLYESNFALGTSLDTEGVLQLIVRKMTEAMDAGACVICAIDDEGKTVTALAEYILHAPGNPVHTWRKLDSPYLISKDPITQQVIKTERPVVGRAAPNKISHWQTAGEVNRYTASWGTVLALPLAYKNHMSGLIEIYVNDPNRNFSPDDIELCQIMATQTTLAIERAQLFDQTRRRLHQVSTLYTMAQKIAGNLNLQEVMDAIVIALRQIIGCRGCCIFLLDANGEQLEIRAADGLKPEWRDTAKLRLGEGIAGLAVAEGRTIYLPDTHQEPGFIFFDESIRSLMVTPLLANGEIIGAINVDDFHPNAFGSAQEQLLTIAAAQVGIAIENARLFAKVSAEQQQTQAIIQHMADGLLVINSQSVITMCNPALTLMLNLPREQIVGQNVTSPDLAPTLANITASTTYRARTGVLAKEVTVETPNPRTLQIFSTTMVDDFKNPVGEVRVVHDVTRERQLERLKDDFMSTISHELRTPLFSIQGFAQILLEEGTEISDETRTEFLTTIHTQAVQLGEMVNNLLDVSKFDEGRLEFERNQVAFLKLLRQASLKLQGFAHQQRIKLTTELPASIPMITGDSKRLEQVLTNLLGNAIKFTPAGGQVCLAATATDSEILVEIRDNGIGIPPPDLERIFSRYFQVKNKSKHSAKGSGLGLHIARRIVEGHGGRIWVESKVGHGSTFRFSLPLPGVTANGSNQ